MRRTERGDPVEREAHRRGTAAQLDAIEREPSFFGQITAHARATDPQTSHDAALAATIGLSEKQRAVHDCLLEFGPMTDVELIVRYHRLSGESGARPSWPIQSDSGIRTRRHELTERLHALVLDFGVIKIGRRHHTLWLAVE